MTASLPPEGPGGRPPHRGLAAPASREARLTFGEVVDDYEELRPSYPPAMFERIVRTDSRVLEVGAGTGKATRALLAAGAWVDAVEPSVSMRQRLVATCPPGRLRALTANIEDVVFARSAAVDGSPPPLRPAPDVGEPVTRPRPGTRRAPLSGARSGPPISEVAPWPTIGAYDVVFAAQAWHWVEPVRATRVARDGLRDGGMLALCWNHPLPLPAQVRAALDRTYDRYAPALTVRELGGKGRDITDPTSPHGAALLSCFAAPDVWETRWTKHYQPTDYAKLLGTQSDHRLLDQRTRSSLLGGIADVLQLDGGIEVSYVTRLVTALRN